MEQLVVLTHSLTHSLITSLLLFLLSLFLTFSPHIILFRPQRHHRPLLSSSLSASEKPLVSLMDGVEPKTALKREPSGDYGEDKNGNLEEERKKRGVGGGSAKKGSSGGGAGGSGMRCCQAEKCATQLSDAKPYHRRHKVCEYHAKAQVVLVAGIRQRFCQQCSRFHELGEFDEMKRSCRRRLAGHNERRRKSSMNESQEGSSRKGMKGSEVKEIGCGGEVDERGRMHMSIQENAGYEHFQIR